MKESPGLNSSKETDDSTNKQFNDNLKDGNSKVFRGSNAQSKDESKDESKDNSNSYLERSSSWVTVESKANSNSYSSSQSELVTKSETIPTYSNTNTTSSNGSSLNITDSFLNSASFIDSYSKSKISSKSSSPYTSSYSDIELGKDINEYIVEIPLDSSESEQSKESRESNESTNLEIPPHGRSLKMKNMVKFDEEVNGEIKKIDKWTVAISALLVIVSGITIITFIALNKTSNFCGENSSSSNDDEGGLLCLDEWQLLANAGSLVIVFFTTGIGLGSLVTKKNINVGYTRKTLHFMSFFLPFGINKIFPLDGTIFPTLLKFWLITCVYFLGLKIMRRKFKPALLIFKAIDRPADRPYTLKWMVTQFIASSLVILPFVFLWEEWDESLDTKYTDLVLVLTIINGLGDGLAEPVGVTIGKHKYKTRAIWYQGRMCNGSKKFTRSYEGSMTVFLVTVGALGGFHYIFTTWQLVVAMITVPIVMTLTEAFSPRTWDSPFLFGIGGGILTGIVKLKDLSILLFPIAIIELIISIVILTKLSKSLKKDRNKKGVKQLLFPGIGILILSVASFVAGFIDIIKKN